MVLPGWCWNLGLKGEAGVWNLQQRRRQAGAVVSEGGTMRPVPETVNYIQQQPAGKRAIGGVKHG